MQRADTSALRGRTSEIRSICSAAVSRPLLALAISEGRGCLTNSRMNGAGRLARWKASVPVEYASHGAFDELRLGTESRPFACNSVLLVPDLLSRSVLSRSVLPHGT